MTGAVACDYSFSRPSPHALAAAGCKGVIRYLAPLPNPKVIDQAELDALHAAGLLVALVWESVAQRATGGGRAGGVTDATEALRQADLLGWPENRPIYMVMEDPNQQPTSDWPAIDAYAEGAASVLGDARLGAYGGQALVEHQRQAGLIAWGWQVGGWSPSVSPLCHLYQRLSPAVLTGFAGQIDEDAILQPDWGAWDGGSRPSAPPATSQPIQAPTVTSAPLTLGGNVQAVPFTCTTDTAGWVAFSVALPGGATKDDVISVVADAGSAYDGAWALAAGSVDYQPVTAGSCRIVVQGPPGKFFTGRVFVAVP